MSAMPANLSPLAGTLATPAMLVDVPKLIAAYYRNVPDHAVPEQRVAFGTSGHRGSAFENSFNEWHVVSITQAICDYRKSQSINGPLFLGMDTHALSAPACASALEVLAANGVDVMLALHDEYTPTPAVSHAILAYNRRAGHQFSGLADGIVITPSHNPPQSGGLKYNLANGGAAGSSVTAWIEAQANTLLKNRLQGVNRIPHANALRATTTHRHDFLSNYIGDLGAVLDMAAIRDAKLHIGVDPLGGAGVHYWPRIAERYGLNLTVVNTAVDPAFRFVTLDWDGQIRMDPSSAYAMRSLVDLKDSFGIAFACDTDHDRHGIVTRSTGLMPSNHYLAVAIDYLFKHRPHWGANVAIGKSVVCTQMIDRIAAKLGREICEMPVGFKWFSDGLFNGSLGFCGEESAGASFLRHDGTVWTTDKDGIAAALLSAEITASTGRDPGEIYAGLTRELGEYFTDRIEAPATVAQKRMLSSLSPQQLKITKLAGETVLKAIDRAPGNGAAIGGIKVVTEGGWFAARPSGTEDIYKIYVESHRNDVHLRLIAEEAQTIVDASFVALAASTDAGANRTAITVDDTHRTST